MKVICEIYRDDTNELGEVGTRAKHSLDFVDAVQYLNLPDEFLNLADEYMVSSNLVSIETKYWKVKILKTSNFKYEYKQIAWW